MGDYIDRQAFLEHMKGTNRYFDVKFDIENFPAADVRPVVRGEWEECDLVEPCVHGFGTIRHYKAGLKCTNCANVFSKKLLWEDNFCPNCGADMRG